MSRAPDNPDPEFVPFFGTWRRIYASVIVVNLIAIAFVYFFSRLPF